MEIKRILKIAVVCHEANKAYCETLEDYSQTNWHDAPDWQRESLMLGVQFHLDNPDASADSSHVSWLKVKEADGWKYGPIKDANKKEHPCFVPFKELPLAQQLKDHLFKSIVHALGYEYIRSDKV